MAQPALKPPARINRYFFKRHGVPATVTTYAEGAEDTHGIPVTVATETSIDYAILSFSRRSLRSEDPVQGSQFVIEVEVYLLDEDFADVPLSAPLKIDFKRPMVTIGDGKYDLFEIEDPPDIGIVRFICRKKKVS